MVEHNAANPDHVVCLSFSDMSFWCYECDSYVVNREKLQPILTKFQYLKFPEKLRLEDIGNKLKQGWSSILVTRYH